MCICINCLFIKDCKSYNFVEKMHNIKPINKSLYLSPKQTIIKNENLIITNNIKITDWDIKECSNFVEKGGNWFSTR